MRAPAGSTTAKNHSDDHADEFSFDEIFGQECNNGDVFSTLVKPMVESTASGGGGCVFAFGCSNSGKTHTMLSRGSGDDGVLWRSVAGLLESGAATSPEGTKAALSVAVLEIGPSGMRDLLAEPAAGPSAASAAAKPASLSVREEADTGFVWVEGQRTVVASSADAAVALLNAAIRRRAVSATAINAGSSRGHTVVSLTLIDRPVDTDDAADHDEGSASDAVAARGAPRGTMTIVDMAGLERTGRVADAARRSETKFILSSLTSLVNVFRALRTRQRIRTAKAGSRTPRTGGPAKIPKSARAARIVIPFRESLLTRILKPCLLGGAGPSGRVAMLLTAAPGPDDYDEKRSAFRQAAAARGVELDFSTVKSKLAAVSARRTPLRRTPSLPGRARAKRASPTGAAAGDTRRVTIGGKEAGELSGHVRGASRWLNRRKLGKQSDMPDIGAAGRPLADGDSSPDDEDEEFDDDGATPHAPRHAVRATRRGRTAKKSTTKAPRRADVIENLLADLRVVRWESDTEGSEAEDGEEDAAAADSDAEAAAALRRPGRASLSGAARHSRVLHRLSVCLSTAASDIGSLRGEDATSVMAAAKAAIRALGAEAGSVGGAAALLASSVPVPASATSSAPVSCASSVVAGCDDEDASGSVTAAAGAAESKEDDEDAEADAPLLFASDDDAAAAGGGRVSRRGGSRRRAGLGGSVVPVAAIATVVDGPPAVDAGAAVAAERDLRVKAEAEAAAERRALLRAEEALAEAAARATAAEAEVSAAHDAVEEAVAAARDAAAQEAASAAGASAAEAARRLAEAEEDIHAAGDEAAEAAARTLGMAAAEAAAAVAESKASGAALSAARKEAADAAARAAELRERLQQIETRSMARRAELRTALQAVAEQKTVASAATAKEAAALERVRALEARAGDDAATSDGLVSRLMAQMAEQGDELVELCGRAAQLEEERDAAKITAQSAVEAAKADTEAAKAEAQSAVEAAKAEAQSAVEAAKAEAQSAVEAAKADTEAAKAKAQSADVARRVAEASASQAHDRVEVAAADVLTAEAESETAVAAACAARYEAQSAKAMLVGAKAAIEAAKADTEAAKAEAQSAVEAAKAQAQAAKMEAATTVEAANARLASELKRARGAVSTRRSAQDAAALAAAREQVAAVRAVMQNTAEAAQAAVTAAENRARAAEARSAEAARVAAEASAQQSAADAALGAVKARAAIAESRVGVLLAELKATRQVAARPAAAAVKPATRAPAPAAAAATPTKLAVTESDKPKRRRRKRTTAPGKATGSRAVMFDVQSGIVAVPGSPMKAEALLEGGWVTAGKRRC